MMKPSKRLTKAKLKEDKFVIFTAKAEVWFEKNRDRLLYGLAGVILVAAIGFGYSWSRKSAVVKASFEELLARDAYSRNDLDSTLIRANMILEDYSGTPSAAVALTLRARIYEQRAQFDEAVNTYEELLDDYSNHEYLAFGATNALATIALGKDDFERAGKLFTQAADKYKKHFNAPVALVEAGKAFEKARRYPQAKQVYRRVLTDYPKSRAADTARDNLAKLEFMP